MASAPATALRSGTIFCEVSVRIMDTATKRVIDLIFEAMDEVSDQVTGQPWPQKSHSTVIVGAGGRLDSLGFVNFVVLLEQKCEEQTGIAISLTEAAQSRAADPFGTAGALAEFVSELLDSSAGM